MSLSTLFLFVALLSLSFCCQLENNAAVCASLEELIHTSNWEKITIKPSENHKLFVLNSSAFQNVKSVKEINILSNNIEDIQPGTFDTLNQLEIISVIGNKISTIKSKVFTKLPVKELILTNNKIQFIENSAFGQMPNLKKLKLDKNELSTFDTKLLLESAPNLEFLSLSRNLLKSLSKDIFQSLTNLKSLYLNNNKLDTIEDNCFQSLSSLKTLDISNNNIKEISPKFFPENGIRTLKNFYIHNNHLCFLHPELLQKLSNIRKLSYGGNPWQCPCWELLDKWVTDKNISKECHEKYTAGQRPECIVTDFAPQECVYDKERLNEVPMIFSSETQGYEMVVECSNLEEN